MTQPSMRLFYNPFSSSARRVVMTVQQLRAPVELVLIKDLRDPVERAQLVALNPNAKIPVLQHGDFVLWESNAIMQYIADQVPGQTLYPTGLRERADVNRWLFWSSQHWAPALGVLTWENWMKALFGAGERDAAAAARGEREFVQFAGVLDAHLRDRQWISGPGLTLADFAVAVSLMRVKEAAIPLADYPQIVAWFERVQALDVWQRTQS